MTEEKISSNESEGLFNDFIQDELENIVEHILNEGDLDRIGDRGSDIVVEMDDIVPPTFVYDDLGAGAGGKGQGLLFSRGEVVRKVPQSELADALVEEAWKMVKAADHGGS